MSGYHSTYMYPHCMSRSAWAHSDAVIWEKGLGEGQWTLRWEPLGGTSFWRRERELLLTGECLSYGAPTEEDANLH